MRLAKGIVLFLWSVTAHGELIYDFEGQCFIGGDCTGTVSGVLTLADSFRPGDAVEAQDFVSFSYSRNGVHVTYNSLVNLFKGTLPTISGPSITWVEIDGLGSGTGLNACGVAGIPDNYFCPSEYFWSFEWQPAGITRDLGLYHQWSLRGTKPIRFIPSSGPQGVGGFAFFPCSSGTTSDCPKFPFQSSFGDSPDLMFHTLQLGGNAEALRDFFSGNTSEFGTNFDSDDGVNLLSFESSGIYCIRPTIDAGGPCTEDSSVIALGKWMVEGVRHLVEIDVKPGSDPNCFNVNGHGVIPVAILGSETFDVSDVDSSTLSFRGLTVRVRGQKGPLCSLEDVNGDGAWDQVCQFEDDASAWSEGTDEATLTGETIVGIQFEGTDSICVVP